jgi:FkbM family methyltransferase
MNLQTNPIPFEVLTVSFGRAERTFAYPNNGNMGVHVKSILTGRTYPLFRLSSSKPGVIVDVGANIGTAALWFLGAYPQARTYCFEPSKFNAVVLSHNLSDLPNVTICPWGLAATSGQARLYQGASQCMQHSTIRNAETTAQAEEVELRSATEELARLDIDHIGILKIDTEGCELPILKSIQHRLHSVDQLYLEYHSEEDRVEMERILIPQFMLAFASAHCVHRGVNLYIRRELAEAQQEWQALRIVGSDS